MMFTDLRICIVQEGKIINEVLFNKEQDVNVGTSLKNDIVLMGVPDKIDLFVYKDGIYFLKLFKGISGKVIEDNKILSFDELVNAPGVVNDGTSIYVPLSQNARGSIALDNNTLLFRMNPSIPVPSVVPKEFQTNFLTDFDFSFILISFFLFLSYIIIVSSFSKFKPKEIVKFEDVPEQFARLILDKPIVVKQVKPKPKNLKTIDKPKKKLKNKVSKNVKKAKTNKKVKRNVSGTKRKGGGAIKPSRKEVAEMVRTSGIIGIIGSKSKNGSSGNVVDLFSQAGFGKKLDKALKGVAGLSTGKSLSEVRMKKGAGSAKAISIGSLKTTTGSGAVAFGKTNVSAVNVLGDASDSEQSGQGSINPGVIAKTLAKHVGAFQYCYNKALRSNAKLSGELKVIFLIKIDGSVSNAEMDFEGPASKFKKLTSCIKRVFRRIRFPKPKGGEVTVGYPLNFTAQN